MTLQEQTRWIREEIARRDEFLRTTTNPAHAHVVAKACLDLAALQAIFATIAKLIPTQLPLMGERTDA